MRSEGVFAVPDDRTAKAYGNLFVFVPFDGYKYVWSNKIRDLFGPAMILERLEKFRDTGIGDLPFIMSKLQDFLGIHVDKDIPIKKAIEMIVKTYNDTDIERILFNSAYYDYEITFKCSYYYLIEKSTFEEATYFINESSNPLKTTIYKYI